jgi:hypothetical protein
MFSSLIPFKFSSKIFKMQAAIYIIAILMSSLTLNPPTQFSSEIFIF